MLKLNSIIKRSMLCLLPAVFLSFSVQAEVVKASSEHYRLEQKKVCELSPDELWQKLIVPSSWWHPEHTYSGDSENLSLDVEAGGLWREDWDGGSVTHGTVLYAKENESLRLDAPFGPLQEMAVTVVWTISLGPFEDGTEIKFTEIANGSPESGLDAIAPAVDYVKTEAINRLCDFEFKE